MDKIFELMFCESDDENGIVDSGPDHALTLITATQGCIQNWKPLTLNIEDNLFYTDILFSAWRMYSEKLKTILQDNASPEDKLQWLDVMVRLENEERKYYILHFPEPPDVLEYDKCRLINGDKENVIVPVFSEHKCLNHKIFIYPSYHFGLSIFIKEDVKKKIDAAGCTGVEISKCKVV